MDALLFPSFGTIRNGFSPTSSRTKPIRNQQVVGSGLRTLPAAGGDQHVDVVGGGATAEVTDTPRIDAHKQFALRGPRAMDASQNRRRAIVVPVEDDVLDDVCVSAGDY